VNPIGPRANYDEGKRVAETLMFSYHAQNGVDIRVVRIFNTYGPRMAEDDGRVVSNFIVQALRGEPLTVYGDGEQTRSFCYVTDMIDGLVAMMNVEGVTGPINLGNPSEFTMLELDLNTPPNFGSYMAFSEVPPAAGEVASGVVIDYDWELVEWRYDAAIGRYRRWSDGVEHLDGNTDEQVVAANIIIISPVHAFDGTICEEIRNGVCAHQSVQIQIWGSGTGIVLRDGMVYNVTWHREGRNDMLTFTDSTNNPFPLQIGNSWVQLVPTWLDNPVTVSP
jgi:hypothetical protein